MSAADLRMEASGVKVETIQPSKLTNCEEPVTEMSSLPTQDSVLPGLIFTKAQLLSHKLSISFQELPDPGWIS